MTPHLGDRLSAFLDGELSVAEADEARVHLEACEPCRAELAATREVRDLVRSLPRVDPPFGFFERALLQRPRWRRGVAGIAAGVAAAIVLLTISAPSADPVRPPVADLVERHAATASSGGDPVTQFVTVGVPVSVQP